MSQVLVGLQVAIELAFAFLAIKTILAWFQERSSRRGYLALAFGALAVDVFDAQLLGQGGGLVRQIETDVSLISFLLSGYGLVMFRDTFVPYSRKARLAITAIIAAIGLVGLVAQLPARPEGAISPLQSFAIIAVLAVWSYCMLDPTATFWLAARGRPAVEKARLRAISFGCLGLLAVVIFGTIAGSFNPVVTAITDIAALAIVPILYVAFFPPVWLRRLWRQPDEDQLRLAVHDLLLYSPDRKTLAQRALTWSERLIGGDAAFVIDSDGSVLATRDMSNEEASALARGDLLRFEHDALLPWRSGRLLIVPLGLTEGRGAMVIVSGRLSPLFADDELMRLRQYATSITAGLDRVLLNERVAALERAKSDFLSIASHELRGPMTVIKGYLTMLEAGAMGEVSTKAQAVLPLLISKSDEVNWMIEQMIEASRLEEGRLALKKQKIDVVELTDIAIDGIKLLLGNHNLNVDQPREAIDAEVDPDRFQIVIRNLLSNASKYSPAGTDIDVTVRRNGSVAFVAVKDHGVGISKEDQARLFTRFNRIENQTHVQGTGLGLWLSREIALMHDGDLEVQSEVGQGSTFTFSLPITR